MRIILALSLMAAILVACGDSGGATLPTAAVRVITATPEPLGQDTCALSKEQMKLLLAQKGRATMIDYGPQGSFSSNGMGLIVWTGKGDVWMEIPLCARQAALAALD